VIQIRRFHYVAVNQARQALPYGIAAEPDPGRQLQEKAGGVTPAGLSLWGAGADSSFEERLRRSKPFFFVGAMDCFRLRQDKSRSLSSGRAFARPVGSHDGFLTSVIGFPLYSFRVASAYERNRDLVCGAAQSADQNVVTCRAHGADAPDHALNKINALI